jgi:hypothetical protein
VEEHCEVIEGLAVYRPAPSKEMRESLVRERFTIARRRFEECRRQVAELSKIEGAK